MLLRFSLRFDNVMAWSIRPATPADVSQARKILFQQLMNPLSISEETLLVACRRDDDDAPEDDDKYAMIGFGQIRPLGNNFAELASLYVNPNYRQQGVGRGLVTALLERNDKENPSAAQQHVCLLTLRPTVPFYEPHGFQVVTNIEEQRRLPASLQLEYAAGSAISMVLGNEIVCMVQKIKSDESKTE